MGDNVASDPQTQPLSNKFMISKEKRLAGNSQERRLNICTKSAREQENNGIPSLN